jgi:hypothetical protein
VYYDATYYAEVAHDGSNAHLRSSHSRPLVLNSAGGVVGVGAANASYTFNVEGSIRASSSITSSSLSTGAISCSSLNAGSGTIQTTGTLSAGVLVSSKGRRRTAAFNGYIPTCNTIYDILQPYIPNTDDTVLLHGGAGVSAAIWSAGGSGTIPVMFAFARNMGGGVIYIYGQPADGTLYGYATITDGSSTLAFLYYTFAL